jgi:hypothetical protein
MRLSLPAILFTLWVLTGRDNGFSRSAHYRRALSAVLNDLQITTGAKRSAKSIRDLQHCHRIPQAMSQQK